MARIAYLPADLAEPADLVAAIRARRGGHLLNLDRMLLHSPPLAQGWNGYLKAVRKELTVAPRLRELAMCGVAALNRADYEFHHHAPEFIAAGGSPAQVDALHDPLRALEDPALRALFDEPELAALQLTVEMTREVAVSDTTFVRVQRLLGDRQTVELVAVIATYNMVSRFLVALGIEPE